MLAGNLRMIFLMDWQGEMKKCEKCKSQIKENEGREFHSKLFCDDCYIDEVMQSSHKILELNSRPSSSLKVD